MSERFRKRPVEVDAIRYDGTNAAEVWAFMGMPPGTVPALTPGGGLVIATLEGDMTASVGDWVVRGVHGEFYPVKPKIFAVTYEEVA